MQIRSNRYSNKDPEFQPQIMVENKISYDGPESQLSIYDTFQEAKRVKLKSDQPLFCAMLCGKKVMHTLDASYDSDFVPHESFVLAPCQTVEIDFPVASLAAPTRCLAIEISTDRITQIADNLNYKAKKHSEFGPWQYQAQLLHTHHNAQTQALLQRMTELYADNDPDRSYMINLAVSELTVRLLRQQNRDFMMSFCQRQPDHSGLTMAIEFFNQFKLHLGCTPLAFQQQQRLKKAAEMIKIGMQITQVSFELGFVSSSHFSRIFKRFYGISPKSYQHRHKTILN
ncbi:AraC family transcriptional regulator [Moritella viscosa]|uniref:AraC family transcriptional regulator n=1 Tax=Moritella viscosa TaxID=80854 RepID=UPI00091C682E|nr:AraC family transcriptional regulator N-terminal domain-containing protein [Moritella viscosa]SGZ08480.1 Putative transcriptional regulator (AraC/XylS family) [Moritella viscosa]